MNENTGVTTDDGVAYADMSWQKLKALMTAEGQDWVNAEHAAKYLTDLDASDDVDESAETADKTAPEEASTEASETESDQNSEADITEEDPEAGAESTEGVTESDDTDATDTAEADDSDATEDEIVGADDLVTEPEVDADPVFDPDESYGEIFGSNKVRYHQGGCYFTGQGKYVPDDEAAD